MGGHDNRNHMNNISKYKQIIEENDLNGIKGKGINISRKICQTILLCRQILCAYIKWACRNKYKKLQEHLNENMSVLERVFENSSSNMLQHMLGFQASGDGQQSCWMLKAVEVVGSLLFSVVDGVHELSHYLLL